MDEFDLKILKILQSDCSLQIEEIASAVGLSPSPCWRRIKKLEVEGVIQKKVALVNRRHLNVNVTVFVSIRTNQHSPEWLAHFAKTVSEIPEVVEFYRMSGNVDYLLKIVVPNIEEYDAIYKRLIAQLPLYDVTSAFSMEEIKATTAMPLHHANVR